MSTLNEVHLRFKNNLDNFLKLLHLILEQVKMGITEGQIIGEIAIPDPDFLISVMSTIVSNMDESEMLELFIRKYHKDFDMLFSAECGFEYIEKNLSKFFEKAFFEESVEIEKSEGYGTVNVNKNNVCGFLNKLLTLKDVDGINFIGEEYIHKIVMYFRSFARSSLKHLFLKRKPLKKICGASEHYPIYIFLHHEILPEIDVSQCLYYYQVDVSALENSK